MGLDGVEILMEIEDRFDITLPVDNPGAVHQIETVGGLYEWILEQLKLDRPQGDLVSPMFELLRESICSITGARPEAILLTTRLAEAIPIKGRRGTWNALRQRLDLTLPQLQRPDGVELLIVLLTFVFGILAAATLHQRIGLNSEWFAILVLLPISWAAAGLLLAFATRPLRNCFPGRSRTVQNLVTWIAVRSSVENRNGFETVGELAERLTALNYGKLSKREDKWRPEDVWRILTEILSDTLGVQPQEISPQARLVKDLGMD